MQDASPHRWDMKSKLLWPVKVTHYNNTYIFPDTTSQDEDSNILWNFIDQFDCTLSYFF